MRWVTGSRLNPLAASRMRGRDAVIPASMKTLPSAPVMTAILPPDPSRMLTLSLSLWTLIGALAASSRIRSTMLRASAKACRGESQPPVAATVVAATQHRQNPRRDMMCSLRVAIGFSYGCPQNSSGRREMRRRACYLRCESVAVAGYDHARARPMTCDLLTLDEGQQVGV